MNKIITVFAVLFGLSVPLQAQVGIGTNSPDPSAALEVASTDKGFLMPRMTTAQREAITSPANGLMVFDTDTKTQWTFNGTSWTENTGGGGKFVDGASADIAYYPDRVGIGLDAFSMAHKLFVRGVKDTDGTNTAARIDAFYTGSGTSTATYGIGAVARNNGSGTVAYAIGSQGIIQNPNSSGGMTTAVGSYPQIYNNNDMSYASAMIAENYNNEGTMTTGRGMDVGLINASGASIGTASLASFYASNDGSVTGDAYGLFIGGNVSGSVGGNSYGLYLSTPFSNVAGDAFALYSDNTNDSYIEGNVGFGTSTPQQKVHIDGVIRLEPQSSPPAGSLGDLYVNTDGNIYFHNGTEWKAIQVAP